MGENVVVQGLAAPLGFHGPHHQGADVGVGDAGQQGLRAAGVHPIGQQGVQDGAGRRIGVLVVGYVLSPVPGVVHQGGHLRAEAGYRAVVVGDVHRRAGASANLHGLAEGVKQTVAQGVAGVSAVEAALLGGGGGDGGQLVGVAVCAGGVGEARGESKGAVAHSLSSQVLHLRQLGIGGQPGSPAHDSDADGGVGDEVKHVAGGVAVKQGEEIRDAAPAHAIGSGSVDGSQIDEELFQGPGRGWRVGQAVHPQRFRGYALADFGFVGRLGEELEVGMGVHINEAGADDIAGGVNGAAGVNGGYVAGHHLHGIAGYGNAGAVAGGAGAVNHRAVGK